MIVRRDEHRPRDLEGTTVKGLCSVRRRKAGKRELKIEGEIDHRKEVLQQKAGERAWDVGRRKNKRR